MLAYECCRLDGAVCKAFCFQGVNLLRVLYTTSSGQDPHRIGEVRSNGQVMQV